MGVSATAAASSTPPDDVSISSRPPKPACLNRSSSPRMYRPMSGFSDASMAVEEARGYSRRRGVEAVRERVRDPRQVLVQHLAHADLVRRVDDRPQQTDSDSLDVEVAEPARDLDDRLLVEGTRDGAVGTDALRNLEGQTAAGRTDRGTAACSRAVGGARRPARKSSVSGWPSVHRNAVRAVSPGHDRVGRARGSMHEQVAAAEELRDARAEVERAPPRSRRTALGPDRRASSAACRTRARATRRRSRDR